MSGDRIIEMTWRCSSCQRQNLGRYKSCQGCGNAKDPSEPFEMPSDTASAPTVTDPGLLRWATAGPDWRCPNCGGNQRNADQNCVNCGAGRADAPPTSVPRTLMTPRAPSRFKKWARRLAIVTALISGCVWNANRPREFEATVAATSWEHVIDVERYAQRDREGFEDAIPVHATDVKRIGRRIHHYQQVLQGYRAESFTVDVPDGYRTETYTEREACGEECTTVPETCREVCTSNDNGFATCRTVCRGGGQKCKTRYCRETKTRQVPVTRRERRTRDVPVYRDEPQYADAFSYKVWDWALERTVREAGEDASRVRWPDGARSTGLARGEMERERRRGKYMVSLNDRTGPLRFELPTEQRFTRFTSGSTHLIRREPGLVIVDGGRITPIQ